MKRLGCEFCRGEVNHERMGHKMAALRRDAGLSQKRLAEILSISAGYLSDLEQGRRKWTPQRIDDYTTACKVNQS